MNKPAIALRILLRLTAVAELFALVGVFMPRALMDAGHQALGLGPLCVAPVIDYLARSLSGFYVIHGGLLWIVSRDIRKYATLIRYIIFSGIGFAILVTVVGIRSRFPAWWSAAEGPALAALCLVMSILLRKALESEL